MRSGYRDRRRLDTGAARPNARPTTWPACGPSSSTGRAPAPDGEAGLWFAVARLREGFIAPQLKLAVIPEHRLLRRRRAERPDRARAGRDRRLHRPAQRTTSSCTTTTASGGSPASTRRRSANVTRDYLELEYRDGDRVFVPSDQLDKISRYVGADGRAPPLSKLGSKPWEHDEAARPPRRRGARGRADQPLRRAQAPRRPRLRRGLRVAARVRARASPTARPTTSSRRSSSTQGGHGGRAADGPADLRRRRLRQDRGGAARRLQGRGATASR